MLILLGFHELTWPKWKAVDLLGTLLELARGLGFPGIGLADWISLPTLPRENQKQIPPLGALVLSHRIKSSERFRFLAWTDNVGVSPCLKGLKMSEWLRTTINVRIGIIVRTHTSVHKTYMILPNSPLCQRGVLLERIWDKSIPVLAFVLLQLLQHVIPVIVSSRGGGGSLGSALRSASTRAREVAIARCAASSISGAYYARITLHSQMMMMVHNIMMGILHGGLMIIVQGQAASTTIHSIEQESFLIIIIWSIHHHHHVQIIETVVHLSRVVMIEMFVKRLIL